MRTFHVDALADARAASAELSGRTRDALAARVDAHASARLADVAGGAHELAPLAIFDAVAPEANETRRAEAVAVVDHAVAVVVDGVALFGDGLLHGNAIETAGAALHRALRAHAE